MGNLAAALTAQATRTPGPRCSVGILLNTLDDIDTKALLKALEPNSGVKGSEISAALRAEGHKVQGHFVKGHTIQRHRNRECGCDAR